MDVWDSQRIYDAFQDFHSCFDPLFGEAKWVAADGAFGMSPPFREGLAALGVSYVLDVPAGFTVWPVEPEWTSLASRDGVHPASPSW